MNIINFLVANWDSVLVIAAVIAVVVFLIVKKQWAVLDKMLFAVVTWAEREYGGSTGSLKLSAVIEKIYPRIPAVIRIFVTPDALVRLIERALEQAKLQWGQNPAMLAK